MNASVHQFAQATDTIRRLNCFTAAEEALANDGLLVMFKLRELLLDRRADNLAGRVNDVMGPLESLARGAVR